MMDKPQTAHAILMHALPNVPFEGWTQRVLEDACEAANLPRQALFRVFPHGVMDALSYWGMLADQHLTDTAPSLGLEGLKIRERIALLVQTRLRYYTPHREALRKAVALSMQPWHAHYTLRSLHRTVDHIWRLAGDQSYDFNWYTKRMLLAAVYSSTLLYWLDDDSENHTRSWEFLQRRINNVMHVGKHMPFGKGKKPRPS